MSNEQLMEALVKLGLQKIDAEVYVHLAMTGPQKLRDISAALEIAEQQIVQSLNNLQKRGMVESILEHIVFFSAVSLQNVFESLVETYSKGTETIQQHKTEIISYWRTIVAGQYTKK